MSKIIGFTYDLKTDLEINQGDPLDLNAEFDKKETIDLVKSTIEALGYKVILIGNVKNLFKMLPNLELDLVFNICEGINSRNREAQVPVILETLGIPYVGSDGLTMSLALDKMMTKKIFIAEGIPTPRYLGIDKLDEHINLDHLNFPMIVKLRWEGTSKGLSDNSIVYNEKQLKNQCEQLFSTYRNSPLLIEELISGAELTVPIIGNLPPEVLPPVQLAIQDKLDLGEMIYTFARVTSDDTKYICPPKISKDLEKKICDLALKTYKAVGCLDFGRVDIRMDRNNNPYVLEVNPLPSLAHDDVFNISPYVIGSDYKGAIKKIIDAALKRYSLN